VRNILLNWQMGDSFGWGILGFNVFAQWVNEPDIRPLMARQIRQQDLVMVDPLRMSHLRAAIIESNTRIAEFTSSAPNGKINGLVIDAVDNSLLGNSLSDGFFHGQINIGRCIFENADLTDAREKLARYDALLCGSTWNADLLSSSTGRPVKVIFEGVDTSIFCPGTKSGVLSPDKFYVFSGGKLEYRKGQDLTLLAFREFSRKHADAVLVTAWQSSWSQRAAGFRGRLERSIELTEQGSLDVKRWAYENGVNADRIIDIGTIANGLMPNILRDMDLCVQPSRAEACTSLPVKEAMACGIPVVVAANTGMKDLIADGNCIPLLEQGPVPDCEVSQYSGWGESNIDEILAALEWCYENRAAAKKLALRQATGSRRRGAPGLGTPPNCATGPARCADCR
jgi:glycosyltransferase involved in cell wall biosynthesis